MATLAEPADDLIETDLDLGEKGERDAMSRSSVRQSGLPADELGDASMYRSLSEGSPIFSDPDYCELVLLGGDFNTFTGHALPGHAERDRVTLERIEAYGWWIPSPRARRGL